MSTSNFISMPSGLPLVCGGLEDYEECKARYEYETGEAYTEDLHEELMELDAFDAESLAAAFSENLIYHIVTVKPGYYMGFQFFVEERYTEYFDLDPDSRYCIDNADAHYYFDCCRSDAIRNAHREKRKIAKWLEKIAENNGYVMLIASELLSNGSRIYTRA